MNNRPVTTLFMLMSVDGKITTGASDELDVDKNFPFIKQDSLDLADALKVLEEEYGCKRLTIQSGGTLNGLFLRNKLIDYIDIVVAPVLIGGKDISTLIDGSSITSMEELNLLGVLQLETCEVLEDSYIRLRYQVTK